MRREQYSTCANSQRGLLVARPWLVAMGSRHLNESVMLDFTHIALLNIVLVLILLPFVLTIHSLFEKGKRPSWSMRIFRDQQYGSDESGGP